MLDPGLESTPEGDSQAGAADAAPTPDAPELTVVVPVHDEVDNIEPLLDEVAAALAPHYAFEAVFVDDGSRDGTAEALVRAMARRPWLRVLQHDRKCGKSAGVRTGALAARAPVLVLMDGDRQNDPAEAPRLVERLRQERRCDPRLAMVAGQRGQRRDNALRRLSSRIANGVRAAILNDGTRDTGCGLKVITREAFLRLPYFDGQHRFMSALVKAQGHTLALETVTDRPRVAGQAKYGVWNRLWVGIGDLLAVFWLVRRCRLPGKVVALGDKERTSP